MRLSLKESRMKMLNATNLDRKSGIRGPKTMGEALHSLSFRLITTLPFVISTEAYPDYLLRAASDGHVCGSP
jgi:hypothetical protein